MKYFVSYIYMSERQTGYGSIEMVVNRRATDYKMIKEWTNWLNENVTSAYQEPCKCVVLNYKRLWWFSL